ncbi:MAG: prephenate dehydratase [Myxococcales bacterium]
MSLDDARKQIDSIDDQILTLLDQRADVVSDVRRAKQAEHAPSYDPERERQLLDRLAARAGRFPKEAIRSVYREVMSACLALQEPTKVAFLGPEGTFSHAAARAFFGLAASYLEATTIDGVFDALRKKEVTYGVVPLENSTEGAVTDAVDALIDSARWEDSTADADLLIRQELVMEVSQCLLTRATGLTQIRRVLSHPQPLGQCRMWLAKNLGTVQLVQTTSTATAVREAASDPESAAIGSRLAGDLYGVPIIRERIQDREGNATRFVMLAHEDAPRTGRDKTTVVFSVKDGRGALLRVLEVFDREEINLTRIESRPSQRRAWDYVFLTDFEGHRDDSNIVKAMSELRERCPLVRHLGSYPRAPASPSR